MAGNVVLDFINTLDNRFVPIGPEGEGGPQELLGTFEDLMRFMVQSGVLSSEEAGRLERRRTRAERNTILKAAHYVRESLAAALYKIVDQRGGPVSEGAAGPDPTQVEALNVIMRSTFSFRDLQWVGEGSDGKMEWVWTGAEMELPIFRLVTAASELLTSNVLRLLKSCESPTCRWLFLATNRNKVRRWCDMQICGNRMKNRRSYSRTRKAAAS